MRRTYGGLDLQAGPAKPAQPHLAGLTGWGEFRSRFRGEFPAQHAMEGPPACADRSFCDLISLNEKVGNFG
jgi:hypothetical protein